MLRDNLQPTDFADAEVRVGKWWHQEFYGGANACRVWICKCSNWWFHRHEWAYPDRNSTQMDPWILYGYYPRKQWEPHLKPAPKDYEQ